MNGKGEIRNRTLKELDSIMKLQAGVLERLVDRVGALEGNVTLLSKAARGLQNNQEETTSALRTVTTVLEAISKRLVPDGP